MLIKNILQLCVTVLQGSDYISKYAEIHNDYINEEENAVYIDAWLTECKLNNKAKITHNDII